MLDLKITMSDTTKEIIADDDKLRESLSTFLSANPDSYQVKFFHKTIKKAKQENNQLKFSLFSDSWLYIVPFITFFGPSFRRRMWLSGGIIFFIALISVVFSDILDMVNPKLGDALGEKIIGIPMVCSMIIHSFAILKNFIKYLNEGSLPTAVQRPNIWLAVGSWVAFLIVWFIIDLIIGVV